ncbi:AsmA-like C-terminal region-containing protein [Fulvimarina sp. 2208YS6-2-32]|uniref:AsmA-like C-terminal region-containing protein n=1 Tax=Fulvimarina uroteuthidis TaxID=3098149 RepID=A0ABU5HXA6_9HYPH|nr:AsmA-like C-terminal region-containing protein [Fulvimarina sp. 2208YS6-2-32]MDY8107722.1 AsmA-like C-terminal region-containing protein [Fulvimarina sp. 2208YS6-2-32]
MRPRPLKRRLIWGVSAIMIIAAAILILPRVVLVSDVARAELVSRIEALTGEPVELSGSVEFSILPRTRLVAHRIAIGSGAGITIDTIIADFDPVDALFGRANIARIVLVRPEHRPVPGPTLVRGEGAVADTVRGAAGARPTAATIIKDLEDLARRSIERLDTLQILVIRNGVWRSGADEFGPNGISNANLTITRSSSRSAFLLDGSFTWNGQPTDIEMRVDSTTNLEAGGESGVSFELRSPPLSVDFDGTMAFGDAPRLQGRFEGRGESFARTARWLSDARFPVPALGAIGMAGDLVLADRTLAIENAEITIAGSTAIGALDYDLDRDRVDGTLAFTTLDLTQIAESIVPFPAGPFGLVRPIKAEFAKSADLALRVSANEARFGSLAFSDVAAVFSVGDGDVSLELGDARLYGGRAFGKLLLEDRETTRISGELMGTDVDLAQLSDALGSPTLSLSGSGKFEARVTTRADDWRTIFRVARAKLDLQAQSGVLSGFDPVAFADPGTRSIYSGFTGGAVPFDRLDAEIRMVGPNLAFDSVSMRNAGYRLDLVGEAELATGTIDLEGTSEMLSQTASSAARSGEFTGPQPIPFTVEGTWPGPRVVTGTP